MKKICLAVFLMASIYCTNGQTSPRTFYTISNGWTDLNISGKIAGKFSWTLENQQRREDMQGDYNTANTTGNLYNTFNQHLFRPYIHYQANPNLRFSLMPLGWIGSNRFAAGVPSAFFSELRMSPQTILTQNYGRVRIDSRLRYEFRWIGKNQSVTEKSFLYDGDFSTIIKRQRIRYQLKATVPLNKPKMEDKTLYAQAFNELFVGMGKNVANTNLLDQNRILIGVGYKFNKFVAFEAGFMRQSIFRFNNATKDNVDRNNIFQTNLAITNVEQIFRKEKKK